MNKIKVYQKKISINFSEYLWKSGEGKKNGRQDINITQLKVLWLSRFSWQFYDCYLTKFYKGLTARCLGSGIRAIAGTHGSGSNPFLHNSFCLLFHQGHNLCKSILGVIFINISKAIYNLQLLLFINNTTPKDCNGKPRNSQNNDGISG